VRTFDARATNRFFAGVFAELTGEIASESKALHPREQIVAERLLPQSPNGPTRLLDFGCGQARLLKHLIDRGYDAYGVEKSAGMLGHARAQLGEPNSHRVRQGSLDALHEMPARSFDIVIAIGVLQYLPDAEYRELFSEAHRLLRDDGRLVVTFQNAFFDLFTFNKYTVDFFQNDLLGRQVSESQRERLGAVIGSLLANPARPDYSTWRARDNVFVRLTNPLLIEAELRDYGFGSKGKYFYEFFGLPPLAVGMEPELATQIAARFEIVNPTAWEGHFLANAFIVDAVKRV
jgi:SAM-dependent methyltransferase